MFTMKKRQWIGPVPTKGRTMAKQKDLPFFAEYVNAPYLEGKPYVAGGTCSVKFACKCGKEIQLDAIKIKPGDRLANNAIDSTAFSSDIKYACKCGRHYVIQSYATYAGWGIAFDGEIPKEFYYMCTQKPSN